MFAIEGKEEIIFFTLLATDDIAIDLSMLV